MTSPGQITWPSRLREVPTWADPKPLENQSTSICFHRILLRHILRAAFTHITPASTYRMACAHGCTYTLAKLSLLLPWMITPATDVVTARPKSDHTICVFNYSGAGLFKNTLRRRFRPAEWSPGRPLSPCGLLRHVTGSSAGINHALHMTQGRLGDRCHIARLSKANVAHPAASRLMYVICKTWIHCRSLRDCETNDTTVWDLRA